MRSHTFLSLTTLDLSLTRLEYSEVGCNYLGKTQFTLPREALILGAANVASIVLYPALQYPAVLGIHSRHERVNSASRTQYQYLSLSSLRSRLPELSISIFLFLPSGISYAY